MAKTSLLKKILFFFLIVIILLGLAGGYFAYRIVYQPNVSTGDEKSVVIYIPTGSDFEDVIHILSDENIIVRKKSFELLAERKKYKNNIKPGRYRIMAKMNNNQLINLLRSGSQEPVSITFNNLRTKKDLAQRVGEKTETGPDEILRLLSNNSFLNKKYGMNDQSVLCIFLPNTYQFYWNTSAEQFMNRMAREYKKFWTESRKAKAKTIGLSQSEVSILASIVQGEQSQFNEEKPIIAGLYLNRLKKKIPLQSDPTLICATGDYTITRVLNEHKEIDSPYNTYKNTGLPPGPICIPEISSIDAVLNYQKNDFYYMCAKEDFSGKHNFSKTLDQHNVYASKYRKALNQNKIYR